MRAIHCFSISRLIALGFRTSLRMSAHRLVIAGLIFCAAGPNLARAATPEEVDAAILKGQAYLLSQIKDGNCEVVPEMVKVNPGPNEVKGWQWGGLTSIATYGILATGVKPTDPRIAPSIDWLAKATIQGHYASGMRAQVWTFLPENLAHTSSAADYKLLLNGMHQADGNGAEQGLLPLLHHAPRQPRLSAKGRSTRTRRPRGQLRSQRQSDRCAGHVGLRTSRPKGADALLASRRRRLEESPEARRRLELQ